MDCAKLGKYRQKYNNEAVDSSNESVYLLDRWVSLKNTIPCEDDHTNFHHNACFYHGTAHPNSFVLCVLGEVAYILSSIFLLKLSVLKTLMFGY